MGETALTYEDLTTKPNIKIVGKKQNSTNQDDRSDLHNIIDLNVPEIDQTEPLPLVDTTKESEAGWEKLPTETAVKDVTGISIGTRLKFRRTTSTGGIFECKVIKFVKDPKCSPNEYTLAPQVKLTDGSNRTWTLDAVGGDDLIIAKKRSSA